MTQTLLYATGNAGKIFEVSRHLQPTGLGVVSPQELGLSAVVEESGTTLEENALLKARAYHKLVPQHLIMADDTGLEIDSLGGEPGVFVRRWKDHVHDMTDQEIIDYTLERLAGTVDGERRAQFRTVIALIWPDGTEKLVDGVLRGQIVQKPAEIHIPGLPFEGLFYVPEWGYLLGETRIMEHDQKKDFLSHRERAVEKVVSLLQAQS